MSPMATGHRPQSHTVRSAAAAATLAMQIPNVADSLERGKSRTSITSMSDDDIIQQNLKEILDIKSREERKANGRLVAVIVAFLVIFMAVYHAWIRKTAALAGMLVPAGIMLSYGAWVVVLAKRDKHRRAMFERHIEEVALKNKCELEQKHSRTKQAKSGNHSDSGSSTPSCSLQYSNELTAGSKHRNRQRRHRQRQRECEVNLTELGLSADVKVHRIEAKRPSLRHKLFGQTIAHVKLLEVQCDKADMTKPADSKSSTAPRSGGKKDNKPTS
ncbi:hypothetical protein AWZ03_012596 [Drosophila navojoa]|uniref:Transmembrane protein n=1 Tax=Drosophila navojoa TaxID=7232 RepID=A0A484AZH5_DRONA|nr:uncharacterized protein LOC115564538 [Drosophila navojoa]TDG40985.1 hypothetical protein AWZ03_012596 [Drosophila navojoa]